MPIIEGTGGTLIASGLGIYHGFGVAGTALNGVAATGALYIDKTAGKLYINTGTLAANVWTVVGAQV